MYIISLTYIQQDWKVQLQETTCIYNYTDKIYFSLYANCSLIIQNKFNLKNRSLKDTTKALFKGPKNEKQKNKNQKKKNKTKKNPQN